jgi:dCMP deaminase
MEWYNGYVDETKDLRWRSLLRKAYVKAWKDSNHDSTKVGAVLVDNDGNVLLEANNYFPIGVDKIKGAYEKPKRDFINNHAERAAVFEAARTGLKTSGLTMVMPWLPCLPCANSVIASGIETLVCHKQMVDKTRDDWKPELIDALKLMSANNVKIIMYDGVIGDCKGFFGKKIWKP